MDRVLPSFPESLSSYAKDALEELGVEVILDKLVSINGDVGVSIDGVVTYRMWRTG